MLFNKKLRKILLLNVPPFFAERQNNFHIAIGGNPRQLILFTYSTQSSLKAYKKLVVLCDDIIMKKRRQ